MWKRYAVSHVVLVSGEGHSGSVAHGEAISGDATQVMDTAAHVALYDFDVADSKWVRAGL